MSELTQNYVVKATWTVFFLFFLCCWCKSLVQTVEFTGNAAVLLHCKPTFYHILNNSQWIKFKKKKKIHLLYFLWIYDDNERIGFLSHNHKRAASSVLVAFSERTLYESWLKMQLQIRKNAITYWWVCSFSSKMTFNVRIMRALGLGWFQLQ